MTNILGNTRRSDISFFASGKIDITSRIANSLGMTDGDVVDIIADRGEYYLYVAVHAADACGRHEARCRPSNRGGRYFRAYSRRLCEAIFRICGVSSSRVSLPAGEVVDINGHKAISIITRNILHQ